MTTTRDVLLRHLFPSAKDVLLEGLTEAAEERRRKSDAARDEWFAHNDMYNFADFAPVVYTNGQKLTNQAAVEFARAPKLKIWNKASWKAWNGQFLNRMAMKDFF